ncbi:MAG TPA: MFS transporter [Chitinophagaceae bacterium]|nr:MFS transporter [Chitinophagaceae bacterium]
MKGSQSGIWKVISASSVGTLIEWYDFYIFGSLAPIISKQFFPANAGTSALLSTLAIFAAGFIVRPFGALVFGRLGDIVGRKYTFLLTLILMGSSTFAIGLIPGYKSIGFAAPLIVLALRLIQGLALGGEYGGAATYVAEHSPTKKRGLYTSWIQTTASIGLVVSLIVIMLVRENMSTGQFNDYGWRIPFLVSAILVIISIYIRMRMNESPLFSKLKSDGKTSVNPLKESFSHKLNLKMVLLALFGATMGQGVIWYTGQFYALSFLENTCKINFDDAIGIVMKAIIFATPFFIFFGWLSDKIGRKWIMLLGMLLGVLTYFPIYRTFLNNTNVTEIAKTTAVKESTVPVITTATLDNKDSVVTTTNTVTLANGFAYKQTITDTVNKDMQGQPQHAKTVYAEKKVTSSAYWCFVFLVFVQVLYVTMVYGPIAAFLVELFPTRIRYTSMSLPYHIGNGVFGGLVPFLSTLIITYTNSPLSGLWYPVIVAAVCFVIGLLYLSPKANQNVLDDSNASFNPLNTVI